MVARRHVARLHLHRPRAESRKERKEKYGDFQIVQGDYQMSQLWVIKVPGELPAQAKEKPKPESLTEGAAYSVADFAWSPDSRRIAFSASKNPSPALAESSDIYVVRLSDRGIQRLVSTKGPDSNPVWSPSTASASPSRPPPARNFSTT